MQRTLCFAGTRQSQPLEIRIAIPSVLGVAHAARLRGLHDGFSRPPARGPSPAHFARRLVPGLMRHERRGR